MPETTAADPLAHYPVWARELARRYFTKTLNQFILHGNVRDLVPAEDGRGERVYLPLRQFLADDLFAAATSSCSTTARTGSTSRTPRAGRTSNGRSAGTTRSSGRSTPKSSRRTRPRVFALLDNYFRLRLADGKRIALVVDYAETVVPMSEAASYSAEDRAAS